MPYYLTYENYLMKPDEIISPPKIANLYKIIKALRDQASNQPGNPYLTIQQICQRTMLQNGQVNAAMNQAGMKELFWGRNTAFGLSNVGQQVADGNRELNLMGISRAGKEHIRPLSLHESRSMAEHVKIITTQTNLLVVNGPSALKNRALSINPELTNAELITVLRSALWQYMQSTNDVVDKINHPEKISPAAENSESINLDNQEGRIKSA